jgi:hypothetical protein
MRTPLPAAGEHRIRLKSPVAWSILFIARRRRLSALTEVEEALTFACPKCFSTADLAPLIAKGALLHSLGRCREAVKALEDVLDGRLVC